MSGLSFRAFAVHENDVPQEARTNMPQREPHSHLNQAIVNEVAFDFRAMCIGDLAEIDSIERAVYPYPWRIGNFQDSLISGYQCWLACDCCGNIAGYFLMMMAPDEAHLLNITVAPAFQKQGVGRGLLKRIYLISRSFAAASILLEVRPSNSRALAIYRHIGFTQIGLRKGYYPTAHQQREDAIVMRLTLSGVDDEPPQPAS